MSRPTTTRGQRLLAPIEIYAWADAGPMQNYANGSFAFDWIALVPEWHAHPPFIPRHADSRVHGDGRTAYFWRNP